MRNYTTSLPPIVQQLLTNNIHYKYYNYAVAVCQHLMVCIGLDNAEYGADFFKVVLVLPRQQDCQYLQSLSVLESFAFIGGLDVCELFDHCQTALCKTLDRNI